MNFDSYIMAFGPHPDDIDYGCGGTLALFGNEGKRNIGVDLTPSQLSTRGDCEGRCLEAQDSAKVLGLSHRFNLGMEDLKIKDDEFHRMQIATMIRKYKPEIIMLPNFKDRHPDHEETAKLVKNSIFVAGLSKMNFQGLEVHKPRLVLEYMIWDDFNPDLVIGIDESIYTQKLSAIDCFVSQKETNAWAKHYFDGRAMKLGWSIGKQYGEGFRVLNGNIGIKNFDSISSKFY